MRGKRDLRSPRFRINITPEILKGAQYKDSAHCMIADAVKEARPDARRVSVDTQTIRFTEGDRRYVYLTPRIAQVSIVRFDHAIMQDPWGVWLANGQSAEAQTAKVRRTDRTPGQKRKRARLRSGGTHTVPVKIGGKTPPLPRIPGGTRRAFGMRAFEL